MARNHDPFSLALSSLRERIQLGYLPGGASVIVQDEAQRLRLSTTPLREALAHLSGEGLVARAPSGGYVTVRLDAAALRERYAMMGEYILIAIRMNQSALGGSSPPAVPDLGGALGPAMSRFFADIVRNAGNQMLWEAYARLRGQLSTVSAIEPQLFTDLQEEATRLYAAYECDLGSAFPEASDRFHTRRIAAAGVLAALIRQRDEGLAAPGPHPG